MPRRARTWVAFGVTVGVLAGAAAAAASFGSPTKLSAPTSGAGKETGNGLFGSSVALSSNGTTALVGAPYDKTGIGAAWVFVRKGGSWSEQARLTAPASGGARRTGKAGFGAAVALSANGATALVGASGNHGGIGAAWVFVRKGGSWSAQARLTAPASGSARRTGRAGFGASVALTSNGTTALVGGPGDRGGTGAAWVFIHSRSAWNTQQRLTAPSAGANREVGPGGFGTSVAFSAGGATALIGGPDNTPVVFAQQHGGIGAAWIFTGKGGVWSVQRRLTAPGAGANGEIHDARFGSSVALSANGKTALIGGPNDNPAVSPQGFSENDWVGAAWLFTRKGTSWPTTYKLTAPTAGPDREISRGADSGSLFGTSVALTPDGATAMIGGADDHTSVGAAWVFGFQPRFLAQPARWVERQKLTAPTGGASKEDGKGRFGASVAFGSGGNAAFIGGPNALSSNDIYGSPGPGAAWVFTAAAPVIK